MTQPQRPKSAAGGTKFEEVVGLGSEYPICKKTMETKNYNHISPVAQMFIDYLKGKVYDSTLERLTDGFVGISNDMQSKMVKFFIDEYFNFNIPQLANKEYTGVWHIDRLLIDLLEMINDDEYEKEMKNR